MTTKRKTLRLLACLPLLLLAAGCGGLNATHSVSPASFFLPGLMHSPPPPLPPPLAPPGDDVWPTVANAKQVALVR